MRRRPSACRCRSSPSRPSQPARSRPRPGLWLTQPGDVAVASHSPSTTWSRTYSRRWLRGTRRRPSARRLGLDSSTCGRCGWATLCVEGHVGRPERQGCWRPRGAVVRERPFVGAHLLGSSCRQTDPTTRREDRRADLARGSSTSCASRPEAHLEYPRRRSAVDPRRARVHALLSPDRLPQVWLDAPSRGKPEAPSDAGPVYRRRDPLARSSRGQRDLSKELP